MELHPGTINVTVVTDSGAELFNRSATGWINHVKPGKPEISEEAFKKLLDGYAAADCHIIPYVPELNNKQVSIIPPGTVLIESISPIYAYAERLIGRPVGFRVLGSSYKAVESKWGRIPDSLVDSELQHVYPLYTDEFLSNMIRKEIERGWTFKFIDSLGEETIKFKGGESK